MLHHLFQDSDHILFMVSDLSKKPQAPILVSKPKATSDLGCYYSINPIDPRINRNDKGAGTPRASINVTAFRNFLFEIDSLPLNVQLELLRYLAPRIPFATVTFSGGSSYHAIVSVADTLPFKPHTELGIQQYSEAWRALNIELTQLASTFLGPELRTPLFDLACKDPARLSRTPGALRPDTSRSQEPISGFGGYVSSDQILSLMQKHSQTPQYVSSGATPTSDRERGVLAKRTRNFIENWKPELAPSWPWHPDFIFAVKDLQSQNYTFEEAKLVLSSITGHLDSHDLYQMRDVWSRNNFRLDFRPVNK